MFNKHHIITLYRLYNCIIGRSGRNSKNIGNIFALVLSTSEPNRLPHSASIAGRFIFLAGLSPDQYASKGDDRVH